MIFIFYLDQVDYDGYCLEYYQGVYIYQTRIISRRNVNSFTKDVQLTEKYFNSEGINLIIIEVEYSPCKTTPEVPISQL